MEAWSLSSQCSHPPYCPHDPALLPYTVTACSPRPSLTAPASSPASPTQPCSAGYSSTQTHPVFTYSNCACFGCSARPCSSKVLVRGMQSSKEAKVVQPVGCDCHLALLCLALCVEWRDKGMHCQWGRGWGADLRSGIFQLHWGA